DGDHFCTENVVIPVLAEKLREGFPGIEVIISETHGQTAKFF
ncbi:MAG: dinuclear metal center protein, YbgI family, partial [Oscillospiraceae bacterium]|nr:dinuclear metal center protein, YbgI family [Oscillospiraceae bacterium]